MAATELPPRPVFEFCEIRKPTCTTVDYDAIETVDADLTGIETPEQLKARMHEWLLARLGSDLHDIGIYAALYYEADEHGQPVNYDIPAAVRIVWDGESAVVTLD